MEGLNLDHVAITVRDMDKSVVFYRDVLGFEVMGTNAFA